MLDVFPGLLNGMLPKVSIHCLELISIFVNVPCHPCPKLLNWFEVRGIWNRLEDR